ncbi:MAG: CarD family transcriptional regulator [Anaerolineales bacterium]
MKFASGDWVVHCTYGLGQVKNIEERTFGNNTVLYYMVQVADLTIWVPADENLANRLRYPTSEAGFKKLLTTLSAPADKLPDDRRQRNLHLLEMLKDGGAESLCKVIRDLTAYRHDRTWSEHDSELMRRTQKALIGEWSYILAVTPHEAEVELNRSLARKVE